MEKKQDPKNLSFLMDLANCYSDCYTINKFVVFTSFNDILYLVYGGYSIISYDIIGNQRINEIKNPHKTCTSEILYHKDNTNKIELIISYAPDSLKLWNFNNWENLFYLENLNTSQGILNACILNDNNSNYIIISPVVYPFPEIIKVFDIKGNIIKEINEAQEMNQRTYSIESYYDKKLCKNFILTGNYGYINAYDFNTNKIFQKYINYPGLETHYGIIINTKNDKTEIIESSGDGNIRIWDFYTAKLLNKIKICDCFLHGICLWNDNNLLIGCNDNIIRLVDLNTKKIISEFSGHRNPVLTLKKIFHPKYGECLISQADSYDKIKLWNINS